MIWTKRCGSAITFHMQNGQIIQTGTAEDIVLAPADDYVAEFVRHMDPLTVLGGMIMQRRGHLQGAGNNVWLDTARRLPAVTESDRSAPEHRDRRRCPLAAPCRERVRSRAAPDGLAVAPASWSLKSIIQLRHSSGHPVLLSDDTKIMGVCGEIGIMRALCGGSGAPA